MNFADRLIEKTDQFGPFCIGLDPHLSSIPRLFGNEPLSALSNWCENIVMLAAKYAGVLKPQLGLFEPFGADGMAIFESVLKQAKDEGLLVIADAKRGDIGSTAKGYARAYLSPQGRFESDALTVNPYLGSDSVQPFIDAAIAHNKGIAVLGRTSNPGSTDIQELPLRSGELLFERVIRAYADQTNSLRGESGWSSFMWVVGATAPNHARCIRKIAPDSLLLIPGFGRQGGALKDALAGFVPDNKARKLRGGVINASRSVTVTKSALTASTLGEWRSVISDAMAATQNDILQATTLAAR